MLEELSSSITMLGRLAETVAARLSRGDPADDWLPQLTELARRVQSLFVAADPGVRTRLRDQLEEIAALVRLAAACGDEWLAEHRPVMDADLWAARLRRAYGLDAELAPFP